MIKTLRKKFIFFAMTAVTVLLLVLLISTNGLTWIILERQADEVLNTLVKSKGVIPNAPQKKGERPPFMPPEMDIVRSSRFFIVQADTDGNLLSCDLNQIFFNSIEDAADYSRSVLDRKATKGHIERYKYLVNKEDDLYTIYFLDQTPEVITARIMLIISGLIALCSWLIMLLFVSLFSKNFVQPIIAGLEKQKQFITNAGHELKTPLAIIQSNNDAMMLIHGENKYNRNIKSQVVRLGELTANLLMQARLDEEVDLSKKPTNISKLVTEILQVYKDSAEQRNISFHSEITPEIIFNTNPQAFAQLLTILMDNSMKYTTDSGDINFTLIREGKNILITEENSCDPEMNIDPEHLFERFYRIDNVRTQNELQSGYGIGLSVARSICKSLGGDLKAYYPQSGRICFSVKF